MKKIARFLVNRSLSSYTSTQVIAAVIMGSTLELGIIPFTIVVLGRKLDSVYRFEPLLQFPYHPFIPATLIALGLPWLAWSIYWQHAKGRGTPFPLLPTKVLLTDGPYAYCRNPMALGAIFWLAGWATFANSLTSVLGGVGLFSTLILSWDKWVEENELKLKHGEEYEIYKENTPFLIPRLKAKRNLS